MAPGNAAPQQRLRPMVILTLHLAEAGRFESHCIFAFAIALNSATPPSPFADISTKSHFELQDLPSRANVWVSLRAVNAPGKSH